MPLPVKSASEILSDQVNAMQTQAEINLDFSIGSDFRALIESNMGNSMWIQALIAALLAVTRLSTSTGNDVDTFIGQFGLKRIPAVAASGLINFSRYTFTQAATVKVGTLVSCVANGVRYSVVIDTANPYYDPDLIAYVIPANTQAIDIPVQAITPGIIGNVLADQINTIVSVLVNVDTVTNTDPFTNGKDEESDSAVKIRFVLYLASLSRATLLAIQFAVSSIVGVARYIVVENKNPDTSEHLGFFYVVIDDGTGGASSTLIANVGANVELYRGLTISYSVSGPTPTPIDVTSHVFTNDTVDEDIVQENVINALKAFILKQPFNALIPYSQIAAVIFNADSSITNVNDYTLNGGTTDVVLTGAEVATIGTLTIIMNA